MSNAGAPLLGVVVSVQGANPGPASGITYTIDVNEQVGVSRVVGVVPCNSRPPDTIDTRAAAVGTGVLVFVLNQKNYFLIHEWPDWGTCT